MKLGNLAVTSSDRVSNEPVVVVVDHVVFFVKFVLTIEVFSLRID